MTAREFWAKQFAANFARYDDNEYVITREQVADVYLRGFEAGLENSAKMCLSFENNKTDNIAILLRAIGKAEVDPETGLRKQDRT